MCIVSNITDWKTHEWQERYPWTTSPPFAPTRPPYTFPYPGQPLQPTPLPQQPIKYPQREVPPQTQPLPTKEELDEFYELLKKARELDIATGQPECEEDVKRKALQDIADQLGVEITFPD